MDGLLSLAYLSSGTLFILSLAGLGKHETAKRGNLYGMVGIAIAIVVTAMAIATPQWDVILPALLVGGLIGAVVAYRIEMTAMPQLVALLHSFVGLAAVIVGTVGWLKGRMSGGELSALHDIEVWVGVFIGAITFTGSIVAFLKLQGTVSGKPLMLPGRHFINAACIVVSITLAYWFIGESIGQGWPFFAVMLVLSLFLGINLVASIGGADMPVVVSMLNSYSGWAAAATGFMLSNDLLIITGALVGSSGAILSYVMCKGMNRSFLSVILGGFGVDESTGASGSSAAGGEVQPIKPAELAEMLLGSSRVVVVPGYGMAVAQAQHILWQVCSLLAAKNIEVKFAIHPVAGRLPGHMNVLLAEANVPYDIVFEMEEINHELPQTDMVLVLGANDIVNPGAQDDPKSPIYGMPVLEVWKARHCVVMKRSMATGYSGVDNPLFYKDNTRMFFGDAKKSLDELCVELAAHSPA